MLDVYNLRKEFPIIARSVHEDYPLVYLDNAATSMTLRSVIKTLDDYYYRYKANIHRGLHSIAEEATAAYEGARKTVRDFINAADSSEIVFTRGTTEAINLVANTFGCSNLAPGDEIMISRMEHHSNIVPWQMLAEARGLVIKVIPIDARGVLDLEAIAALLTSRTRLIAVTHVSNVLGTINPIAKIAALAHEKGAFILVDGAQATPHMRVDVQALDVDFYAFSGHKVYGPTGVGVLYGRKDLLELMQPWQVGGDMIKHVSLEENTTFASPPHKFEAGTPDIGSVIALSSALRWLLNQEFDLISDWESRLLLQAQNELSRVDGLRIIGRGDAAVVSFTVEGVHAQDIGLLIDQYGVALRTGHHCAQPLHKHYGVEATCRASFALYNTLEEVEIFITSLKQVVKMLRK